MTTPLQDALTATWRETADLYARFGLDENNVPDDQRRRYLNEEVLELMEASVLESTSYNPDYTLRALADEAADVLVTVCGLLQAHGVTPEQFGAAIGRVNAKNAAKTEANGYRMVANKIRKVTP